MLPVSAVNSNFSTVSNPITVPTSIIDIDGNSCNQDLFGTQAINQAIENLLCTMPGERLFNAAMYSSLYEILFDNYTDGIEEQIYSKIELFVPVTILRDKAQINYIPSDHTLQISIPWQSTTSSLKGVFKRHIGR